MSLLRSRQFDDGGMNSASSMFKSNSFFNTEIASNAPAGSGSNFIIDIDCLLAKAKEQRRCATGEVDFSRTFDGMGEAFHELVKALDCDFFPHAIMLATCKEVAMFTTLRAEN
jgi:hypothetical protein